MKSFYLVAILVLASWSMSSDAACTTSFKSNLRGMPSTSSSIIASLPKYSPLEIIEEKSPWFHVKSSKFEGWIFHTLIDDGIECMTTRDTSNAYCPSKHNQKVRDILYTEGFKVIKKEIGCNLVLDKHGRRLWLSNTNIWPESASKKIRFN